MSVEMIE